MKFVLAAVTAALLLTAQTATADAKGCIKGALFGGAAGHMVGHGKMGAVAGCVVGHHNANKKQQQTARARFKPLIKFRLPGNTGPGLVPGLSYSKLCEPPRDLHAEINVLIAEM